MTPQPIIAAVNGDAIGLGSPEPQAQLVAGMEAAAAGRSVAEIARHQDATLMEMLKLLR